MKSAYSLFVCEQGPIKQYLKKYDDMLHRKCSLSMRYEDFVDSDTVIKLPGEDYIVRIRKEIKGFRGSISIQGPRENKCKDLLVEFFKKTGATRVYDTETCFQFFVPVI